VNKGIFKKVNKMRDKIRIKYVNKNEQKTGTLVKIWGMTYIYIYIYIYIYREREREREREIDR